MADKAVGQGMLLEALKISKGIVCLVGAGGKKTTLYRVAQAYRGRVGITATVYMPAPPRSVDARLVVAPPEVLASALTDAEPARIVAFFCPSDKPGRLKGVPPTRLTSLYQSAGVDLLLVKADGARTRWLKAPGPDEPQLPEEASTVIPVVSAAAIGQPLTTDIAHRIDFVASVGGLRAGDIITPEHVARILADEQGALKGVGQAQVVPLINMVDDAEREALARQAAGWALALSRRFDRVVLASMLREVPIIEVVER